MQFKADPRILLALENALAASRWRIAARYERADTARRYERLADLRSAAATELLNELVRGGPGDRPPPPDRTAHGGRVSGSD